MSNIKKISLILLLPLAFSCGFFGLKNKHHLEFEEKTNMRFVEGSQDIPLAKDLEKIPEENLSFDSLGGNIISISYKNSASKTKVKDFYVKTLPQMGWKMKASKKLEALDSLHFARDEEKLEIEFVNNNVRFFVESSSK